jgi:dihydrofolate reductase
VRVSLIAAVAANGVIGRGGGLPWHLPADLERFKELTTGHHLIVGRATWESIGKPLPRRTFVVVSRRAGYSPPGALALPSVQAALALARAAGDDEPFVAGGAGIYREAFERDLVDRLYLTTIHRDYEGDTRFPPFDESGWRESSREPHAADPDSGRPAFDFRVLDRVRGGG